MKLKINNKKQLAIFSKRLNYILAIIICCFIFLLYRLCFLQILNHDKFQTLSSNNRLRVELIEPKRGLIYDTNNIIIAENIPHYDLMLNTSKNSLYSIATLAELLKIDKEKEQKWKNLAKKSRNNRSIILIKNINEQQKYIIYANLFKLYGVSVNKVFQRNYPFDSTTTTVLGLLKQNNATSQLYPIEKNLSSLAKSTGVSGIEKSENLILSGSQGYNEVEVNAKNRQLRITNTHPATNGKDLILTINVKLQKKIAQAFKGKTGAAVVINTNNGEILALSSFPSFSANVFYTNKLQQQLKKWQKDPEKPLFNRVYNGLFPPASTIKPIIALMGLHLNILDPNKAIYDKGYFQIDGTSHVYRDHKGHSGQWINLEHAIAVSCDTYFYQLALKLGITNIANILYQFGFGRKIIDLESKKGIINTPEWKKNNKNQPWYKGDTIISGIGQGNMLATPLQLAHMASILAMRGNGFKPHIIKSILDNKQISYTQPIEKWQMQPIKKIHYERIIKAMQMVIHGPYKHNTAWRFGKTSYSIAGKTGTAELYHRYTENALNIPRRLRDHALFIGFAPVKNPKVAIALLIEHEPSAVTVARKIFDAYFELYP